MKINRALSIVLVALMLVAMLPTFTFASATGTVTIAGNSEFVSAPVGTYSKLTYTAAYSDGQAAEISDPTAFSWEVTKGGTPATDVWCVDGEFIVAGGASGTYNIVATHKATGAKSAAFPVAVTASTLYDWSTNIPASGAKAVTTDTDGNAYHAGADNGYSNFTYATTGGLESGVKTVQLKFRFPEGVYGYKTVLGDTAQWKENIKTSNITADNKTFTLYRQSNGINYAVCDLSGKEKVFNVGSWYELSLAFDLNSGTCDLYVDGELCKIKSDKVIAWYNGSSTSAFRFYTNADDAVTYSGIPYSPDLEIGSVEKEIIVPQADGNKAYIQLTASSLIYGSENITWSVPATAGVSIDANTGLVTVTNAASAGTVKVTATQAGMTAETDITLKVVNEDFEAYDVGKAPSPWFYSNIASDGDGKYISISGSYIGRSSTDVNDVVKSGSMVIEFKFKGDNKAKAGVRRADANNWTDDYVHFGSHSSWTAAKMVYNNSKNANGKYTLTAFVGDEMLVYNQELVFSGDIGNITIYVDSIDDFKMYGVDFAVPAAYDVALSNTAPGSELALSYKYYNEGSVAESGTEIVWSYADSKDSANWTDLTEYNNKTSIDAAKTATLKGKYVKAVVTPKCVNPYTNEVVAGAPVEKVVVIDDVLLSSNYTVDGNSFNIDSDFLAAGKTLSYTFGATQIQDDAVTYMVVAAKYTADGKELLSADAKELTTEKDALKSITVSATKTEDSIIKLFVFKKADISPVIYNPVK